MRLPLTAPRQISQQARLEREVDRFESRGRARAPRRSTDMDLTLLPDDALATTLRGASACSIAPAR